MADQDRRDDWAARARAELKGRDPESLRRDTLEGIEVKPVYDAGDLEGLSHLHACRARHLICAA